MRTRGVLVAVVGLLAVGSAVPAASAAGPPAPVTVTDLTTVFGPGGGTVHLATAAAAVTWAVRDRNGVTVRHGSAPVAGGTAAVPARGLGAGWYALHLAGPGVVATDTTIAVLPGGDTGAAGTRTLGGNLHPQTASAGLPSAMTAMGAGQGRLDLRWELVEKTRGVYTFDPAEDRLVQRLRSAGIRPVFVLGYANPLYDQGRTPSTPQGLAAYGRYAAAAARHYGSTADYDVYNEYNLGFSNSACGQTPDCYLALLKATATAVHTAVPAARIVGPSLGGYTPFWIGAQPVDLDWMRRLFDLGGLRYLDVVAFHNYNLGASPEGANDAVTRAIRALLAGHPRGRSVPLWLLETGQPTIGDAAGGVTEAQQAQWIVRDAVSSLAAGLDRYTVYDMLDDYPDPLNAEGRFGLTHNPAEAAGTTAPKPAYVWTAVLARQLADRPTARSVDIGTAVRDVRLTGSGRTAVDVLWAPQSDLPVQVRTTRPVAVTSADGVARTLYPTAGVVTMTAGPDVQYLAGLGAGALSPVASAGITVTPRTPALQSHPVDLDVHVDRRVAGVPAGRLVLRTPYGQVTVPAATTGTQDVTLELPGFDAAGPVVVPVDVVAGGRSTAALTTRFDVATDPVVTLTPHTANGAQSSSSASVGISYRGAAAGTTLQTVSWRVGSASGTTHPGTALDTDGHATTTVPANGLPLWTPLPYRLQVTFSDGRRVITDGTTAFAPVYPPTTASVPAADLSTVGHWISTGGDRSGPDDLGGTMWLAAAAGGVTVHARISDDVDHPSNVAPLLWQGDSLQFGFVSRAATGPGHQVEFGAADVDGTPTVYAFSGYAGAVGPVTDATATVERDETTHVTTYAVTLPWSDLGLTASTPFDFSLLVNDDDGAGRKGFLEWGSGIGVLKDATKYLPVELEG